VKKISKYQVFTELQYGPITRVFKALQPELQRIVLVKQLNPDLVADIDLVERFKQEGLILAKINSPNVITIFDFGFEDDVPFLVTEFVEGYSLAELIKQQGQLPWDIALFILQQLAQGLSTLHQRKILHQDIKPENIFISNEGEVKLGDLGFSTSIDQAAQQIQGTPAYLSPEVVLGSPVDFRSDQYSLGLVGYEILTGENPYAADDIQKIFNRITNIKPVSVHSVRREVPGELSDIISKATARNPDERHKSVKHFHQELENLKISHKIQVNADSLIAFLGDPENYQITELISNDKSTKLIQIPEKRWRAIFAAGVVMAGIILIIFFKSLNNGFSLFHNAPDTTKIVNTPDDNQNMSPKNIQEKLSIKQTNEMPEIVHLKEEKKGTVEVIIPIDTSTMVITPIIERDSIIINSDPRAVVFHKDDSLGITPFTFFFKNQNEHLEIDFKAPGFPAVRKTVTVSDLVAHNIHINLWKEVGYLGISIRPWGELWIDSDSIDVSPIERLIILTPGNHKITARHPSFKDVTLLINIAVGETLRQEIQLQRKF